MPKPAQSGWPAEYHIAGVSIRDVVPARVIAINPAVADPVSRETMRAVRSITATKIKYELTLSTIGKRSRFAERATSEYVNKRHAGATCVLCGSKSCASVVCQLRAALT
jgi:hypothetical protein